MSKTIPILPVGAGIGAGAASFGASAGGLRALPPLSLYVHLPWCLRKCPYCDFNSHEWRREGQGPDIGLQQRYSQALVADLEAALPQIWGRPVHSIFFGGGTPSLFEPSVVAALIGDLRARLRLEPGCEITLEANPGTFEKDRFRAYAQAGVTRLSLGVQSFQDDALTALGRVHNATQARAALREAAEVFSTWNLDLMYALPGQDMAALQEDLATALDHAPPHLSIYHLTLEPNTRFHQAPPPGLPDDDLAYAMLDAVVEATESRGLQRYEVSAFAQSGHRCTHNLNYWRFGDYLGIGAGAHSKLSFPDRLERQTRWREPQAYLDAVAKGQAVSNRQVLAPADLPFEFMLNGLRLVEGVSLRSFEERTGLSASVLEPALRSAAAKGLIERDGAHLRPNAKGLDFLSDLQELFLAD